MSFCSGYYIYVPQDGWILRNDGVHRLDFEVRDEDYGLWTLQTLCFSPAGAICIQRFPRSAAAISIIWSYTRALT